MRQVTGLKNSMQSLSRVDLDILYKILDIMHYLLKPWGMTFRILNFGHIVGFLVK